MRSPPCPPQNRYPLVIICMNSVDLKIIIYCYLYVKHPYKNPQYVAHFYLYFIGDSHRDYIDHSFHMKSSYVIELFVEQSDVKFSGL